MGCLNSSGSFSHWFGNIHLSGPCNRSCYFCIGQHMMALDSENNLKQWPLRGFDKFVRTCHAKGVRTVYLTGTNTDPLLYAYLGALGQQLHDAGFRFGIRTNGVAFNATVWRLFDEASVTVCSLNQETSHRMMGGNPPDMPRILMCSQHIPNLKVNVVIGPENVEEIPDLLSRLARLGVKRVNLREPYGQPHIGDPLRNHVLPQAERLGMPVYDWSGMSVTYWDVHYCEVESVNLYATGRVSVDYPITRGCADDGIVQSQEHFGGGRVRKQWLKLEHVTA